MNSTGLRLSPCGVPIDVAKAWQSPVDSRGSSEVSASSSRIIRISDSSRNVCSVSRSLSRRIVSKARLWSMPRNSIDTRCRCALALSQLYPKSTSVVIMCWTSAPKSTMLKDRDYDVTAHIFLILSLTCTPKSTRGRRRSARWIWSVKSACWRRGRA